MCRHMIVIPRPLWYTGVKEGIGMNEEKKMRQEQKKMRREQLNAASQKVLEAHGEVVARVQQMTSAWIVVRCACTIVLLAIGVLGYLNLSAIVANLVVSIAAAFVFAWLLRRGLRIFAWLGLVGGVYGMLNFLLSLADIGPYLAAAPLLALGLGAMMLDALTQFVVMVLLGRNADSKALAAELNHLRDTIR